MLPSGESEPFPSAFRRTGPNRIEGDAGFVVEVLNRTEARVGMRGKTFRVSVEAMSELTARPTMTFFLEQEVLDEENGLPRSLTVTERRTLGANIERAFEFAGWCADVRYANTWIKRNEALFELLLSLQSRIGGSEPAVRGAVDLALETTSTVSRSFLENARIAIEKLCTSATLTPAERSQLADVLADLVAGHYVSTEPSTRSTEPNLEYVQTKTSNERGPRSEVEIR